MALPRPAAGPGAARRRRQGGADAGLKLLQDGVLPGGEPHVAGQRQLAARAAGPAADLCDRHDRQLAELGARCPATVVRPACLGRLCGVLGDLGQVDVRMKYSGSALSSTTTAVSWPDSSSPSREIRSRTSSGPIRFIGRRVNDDVEHTVVGQGDPQRGDAWAVTWLAGQGKESMELGNALGLVVGDRARGVGQALDAVQVGESSRSGSASSGPGSDRLLPR